MPTDLHRPTGSFSAFPVTIPETRVTSSAYSYEHLHRQVSILREDVAGGRREALTLQLDGTTARWSKRGVKELLSGLRESGFSWRDVARVAGVSVPAVQKWRRGEGVNADNHLNLARIRAVLELLEDRGIEDPVSWLEMTVKQDVLLSKLDIIAMGRFDLVLELASDEFTSSSIDPLLNEFDPEWRSKFVDDRFESFVDSEGVVAIRSRG